MEFNGPVWKLVGELGQKKGISEIIINNIDNIYAERNGELVRLNIQLRPEDIKNFCVDVAKFNRMYFGPTHPILDGILPDGSRINIISSEYTSSAPAITIRRYLKTIQSLDENIGIFGLSEKWSLFLKKMVQAKLNLVISGGTGTGKTTLLNLLLQEVGPIERIITIEDTKELSIKHPNVVGLVARNAAFKDGTRLSIEQLLKNTLRMRPDRIIVGEVRGGEAFDMLQAMNTGHDGSMSTIHANSPGECLSRLENLFLFTGRDIPVRVIRKQMATAIDFIIQISRNQNGERVITRITELAGMEGEQVLMQDIGKMGDNAIEFTGLVPKRIDKLSQVDLPASFFLEI